MVNLVYYLTHLLFFGISLLYYYIILRSLILFRLSSGDMYIFLAISLSCSILSVSFRTVSELICDEPLETFVILLLYNLANASTILFPIRSPVSSAVFWIAIFESFKCVCSRLFHMIKKFMAVFTAYGFTYIFTNVFY